MIVVNRSHVSELLTAPEEYIPFSEAFADFGFEYMFKGNIFVNYHNRIILGPLMHNASRYSLMLDEMEDALAGELGHVDNSCEIPVISSLTHGYRPVAIHKTSARIVQDWIVGPSLDFPRVILHIPAEIGRETGRNEEYLDAAIRAARAVSIGVLGLRYVPKALKGYLTTLLCCVTLQSYGSVVAAGYCENGKDRRADLGPLI
jgi:hypothetical protein